MNPPPSLIALNHDEYHATHIGRTADGRQFWLTTPFVPATQNQGERRAFIAVYLFDMMGRLLETRIDDTGALGAAERKAHWEQRLAELGPVTFGRIEVCPFAVQKFGFVFGLILSVPEDHSGKWYATLEPGNYMAFYAPWNSGDYDT